MATPPAWKTEGRSPIKQIISHQENMMSPKWETTNRTLITMIARLKQKVNTLDNLTI